MFTKQFFFGCFIIQFIARENLIYVLHRIFCFRLEQKKLHKTVTKARPRKAEHSFANKALNYETILPKFEKVLSNIAVLAAHKRQQSQPSEKFPPTKHTSILRLNHSTVYYATYKFNTHV